MISTLITPILPPFLTYITFWMKNVVILFLIFYMYLTAIVTSYLQNHIQILHANTSDHLIRHKVLSVCGIVKQVPHCWQCSIKMSLHKPVVNYIVGVFGLFPCSVSVAGAPAGL